MGGRSVRVLHISDLHMRSANGPQAARVRLEAASRWRAPGAKWAANLAEILRDGTPVDLVVFTGYMPGICTALVGPPSAMDRFRVVPELSKRGGRQMHAVGCLGPTTLRRRV